jgi:hypothetical protein
VVAAALEPVKGRYDGSLLKDIAWSGPVSGNVHKTYDSSETRFQMTRRRATYFAIETASTAASFGDG